MTNLEQNLQSPHKNLASFEDVSQSPYNDLVFYPLRGVFRDALNYQINYTLFRMADVTVVKYSHDGEKFEILVKPDPALDYKLGKKNDVSSVLISDDIYSDSGKGTKPATEKLLKAFGTEDLTEIAKIILQKGDLNLTTDQRRKND